MRRRGGWGGWWRCERLCFVPSLYFLFYLENPGWMFLGMENCGWILDAVRYLSDQTYPLPLCVIPDPLERHPLLFSLPQNLVRQECGKLPAMVRHAVRSGEV